MRRVSTLRNHREIELERQREEIRNIRWKRWRNEILTIGCLATGSALAVAREPIGQVARAVRALVGV